MAATLCELVEGKENKLTIFSTWTIMLGCYESNVIFQQSLQTWATGRNSQIKKKFIAEAI